jgi:tetratricopeptide (TPR) repeat protein
MPEAGQRIEDGIRYQRAGALDRALDCFEAVVALAEQGEARPEQHAAALRLAASVHRTRCDWDRALAAARRSADIAKNAGLRDQFAEALNAEALVHQSRGEIDDAVALLERALAAAASPRVRGNALQNLGTIAAMQRDFPAAERRFSESYLAFKEAGHEVGTVTALINFGRASLDLGELDAAAPICARAVAEAQRLDHLDLLAVARINHAEVLAARGDTGAARELATAALGHFASAGNTWRRIECLRLLGDIALQDGSRDTALRSYQQGLELAERIGARIEAETLRRKLTSAGYTPPAR